MNNKLTRNKHLRFLNTQDCGNEASRSLQRDIPAIALQREAIIFFFFFGKSASNRGLNRQLDVFLAESAECSKERMRNFHDMYSSSRMEDTWLQLVIAGK